jgi:hypothetical protein
MPDQIEFFDPRQLRSSEEVMPLPPQPLIEIGRDDIRADPSVVRVSGDISYQRIERARTPMPEAWLAFFAGLVTLASVFSPWTHVSTTAGTIGIDGFDLGGYGRLVFAAGALTMLLGLAGLVFRIGRIAVLAWPTGLASVATAAQLIPEIVRGNYRVTVQGQQLLASGLQPLGVALLVLGCLATFTAAAWASSQRIGR